MRFPLGGGDEATLLVYPETMSLGAVPHLDFFTPYGPGTYRLLQAVYAVFGPSILAERSLGLLYHIAIVLGIAFLMAELGRRPAMAAGVTSSVVFLWFVPYAYAWMGALALLTWSLALSARGARSWQFALSGALGGLATFWRPEAGLIMLAFVPVLLRSGRSRAFLSGLTIGIVPLGMHVVSAGSSVFNSVIAGRASVNAQTSLNTVDGHVWLLLILCTVCVAGILGASLRRPEERPFLVACGLASALILPQGIQRIDIYHAIFVGCFILPIGSATLAFCAGPTVSPASGHGRALVGAISAIVVGFVLAGSWVVLQLPIVMVGDSDRSVPLRPGGAHKLQSTVDAVRQHVHPSSSVFMGAQDMSRPGRALTELYYLLPDYGHDFFYLELAPGASEKPKSPLLNDLRRADALVLESTPPGVVAREFPHIQPQSLAPNELVLSDFTFVQEVGSVRIYLRKDTSNMLGPAGQREAHPSG